MLDLAVVQSFGEAQDYLRIGGISLLTEGTTRPEWFCAIETLPSAADLFPMKAVLIVFLLTFAPALCVAQADSARDLDFPFRMGFTCQEKVRQCITLP
jgi:hypothetical protein